MKPCNHFDIVDFGHVAPAFFLSFEIFDMGIAELFSYLCSGHARLQTAYVGGQIVRLAYG